MCGSVQVSHIHSAYYQYQHRLHMATTLQPLLFIDQADLLFFYYAIALFHERNTKHTKDGTKGISRVAWDSLCHETLLPYPLPTACFFVCAFVFGGSAVFFGVCGLCVLFSVSA